MRRGAPAVRETHLEERQIGRAVEDLPRIAADSLNDYLMPNTPVPLTQADVLGLLKEAW